MMVQLKARQTEKYKSLAQQLKDAYKQYYVLKDLLPIRYINICDLCVFL